MSAPLPFLCKTQQSMAVGTVMARWVIGAAGDPVMVTGWHRFLFLL